MKVLITGGAGYIGSHTIIDLINNDFEIFVVDNYSNSSKKIFDNLFKIIGKKIEYTSLDLLEYDNLLCILKKFRPDAVIHFAGLKSVNDSQIDPISYYHVNVNGSINLLKAMETYNCNNIVFSSSATVYGRPKKLPVDEKSKCNPINAYGKTKLHIENMIMDWCNKKNENNNAILLRYFNPVGAHPSGLIGENPVGIPNNLFPFITQVISGKQKCLSIFVIVYNTIDGTGVRDYIHICDLARAHVYALEYLKNKKCCEVINLGSGTGFSVLEIIESFNKFLENKISYKFTNRRDGDLPKLLANYNKAKKILKWEPKLNLNDMVKDTLNWYKKFPNGIQ